MPRDNYRYCPHCQMTVHRTTFFRHKGLYYAEGKWETTDADVDPGAGAVNAMKDMQSNNTRYCSHCNKNVSERTFYYHQKISRENRPMPEEEQEIMNSHVDEKSESVQKDEQLEKEVFVWSDTPKGRNKQRVFLESFVGGNIETDEGMEIKEGNMSNRLQDLWENLTLEDIQNDMCSNPKNISETNKKSKKAIDILHWIVLFVSLWATYFNISGNALQHLLHFLKAIFVICGRSVPIFSIIAALFPTSLYTLYKLQGTEEDSFTKFVVCPDCMFTYLYEECVEMKNGKKISKKCNYIKFPNHPHRNKRKACGAVLLKEITLKNNVCALYPRKLFCYNSVKNSLKLFLDRPGFAENCESWKKRNHVPGTYRDIYDGKVWRSFQQYQMGDGQCRPFLDLPRHYGLLLNVDWFQPYKHCPYSVGVMYLVLLNLPREERFKQENVILVGVLPGPREPTAHQMSFFVRPLVDELLELFTIGMEFKGLKYFAVLLGCACDLPAGRKLCGLLSYNAKIGCSKCTKEFDTKSFGEKTDYGGFDTWYPKRNYTQMKLQAEKARQAKTVTEQQAIEKAAGCRWTELMRLPYFDSVQMVIIDPLHSLFLGVAKYFLKEICTEHCNFTNDVMFEIQEIVDKTQLPDDVGRIPHKISSNFASFTADQHRNWTIYSSIYALKPYIPKEGYEVWKHFVEACWIFTRPVITVRQVSQAHQKMMDFLKGFETWLGSSKSTPNFHMNSHLAEQILDYGTVYSYWCFPFERYNGIQSSFHTNQKSVECQLMRKFLRNIFLCNISPPEEYKSELEGLLTFTHKDQGSLALNVISSSVSLNVLQQLFDLAEGSVCPSNLDKCLYFDESFYATIGCGKSSYVESACHKRFLHASLKAFLGTVPDVSGGFQKYAAVNYLGEKYGSLDGTLCRNSYVIVNSWIGLDGNINLQSKEDRPAEIIYFLKLYLEIDNSPRPVTLACVRWFQKHSAENYYKTDLAKVYAKSIYEIEGPACFVPIQKIKSKFVSGFTKVKGEGVRIVIPKSPKIYW